MMVVRPVREEDVGQLVELAVSASFGLTSLPRDRDLLAKRIAKSLRSFQVETTEPGGELYLFVMEDTATDTIAGTSGIVSKVGGFEPFYAYRVETCLHQSEMLQIRKEVQTLNLVAEHSGPCEIGGLFLAPEYRRHGNGRLLSLFRFLFMVDYPSRFEPNVIAEMRGVVDEDGRSPFWEAIGHHFFDMDFPKADYLSVMDKRFIADLMPKCPIYVSLLPRDAQEVIGKVHDHTRPALKMLQDEGFRFTGMVDIFEAGPIIVCQLDDVRIVRESRNSTVREITAAEMGPADFIITNTSVDFCACMGPVVTFPDGEVQLHADTARALGIEKGDPVRFGPLRPAAPQKERA
ncbi:MAG: arginine N-succinyltransferase [Deltaproteobacteria bacterium]